MMENKNPDFNKVIMSGVYPGQSPVVQIFVFRGEECLGWDCFSKEKISIGSGPDVDLVLSDRTISDVHAVLAVQSGAIRLTYYRSDGGKGSTHDSPESIQVGPLDSIVIGPYTLKTKVARSEKKGGEQEPSPDENVEVSGRPAERYNLVFDGRIKDGWAPEDVKANLKALLRTDDAHMLMLFSGRKVVLKRDADHRTVVELQRQLAITGALCSLEPIPALRPAENTQPVISEPECHETEEVQPYVQDTACVDDKRPVIEQENSEAADPVVNQSSTAKPTPAQDDGDDDEDGDVCASFSLRDMIRDYDFTGASREWNRVSKNEILLEVVKGRQDSILDVRFLHAGEKYLIQTDSGPFCLAENKGGGKILLHMDEKTTEGVHAGETSTRTGVPGFHSAQDGGNPRRLSVHEKVIIHHGPFEYLFRSVTPGESPKVKDTPKNDREYARHFGRSVIFHVVILVILGMMPTYRPEPSSQDKHRFVQVDSRQIDEIRKRIQPPQLPKKAPEIIKLKEQQVAQKRIEKRPEKTSSPAKKLAATQTQTPNAVGGTVQAKEPQKNVSQAGILSMLGDNIGIKPQEAMAAVTNLDAVSSANAAQAQFKVGGIVGKLDGGKIEIPKAGIVNTKGSSQVMTGGGPGGTRVAALDKGTTGSGQVKAKVTAHLNKTVKVQGGGMSREEVKRIIDQHLEEITYCYETALVANPSLMGRVVFEWKILLSGKVGEVRIKSSTLNSTDIHSCIQSSIRTWEFPSPDGTEVIVSYPFIFDIVGF